MVDQSIIAAFDEIYHATNTRVLAHITSKCSNLDDISDIFQETYTELFSVLCRRGLNYIKNSEAFAMKLAKYKIYKYYTIFEKLKLLIPMSAKSSDEQEFDMEGFGGTDFILEDRIEAEEYARQINAYLIAKSVEIRRIFYLYYSLELTIPQISTQLGLTESNVKNKLYRTLTEMRKTLLI